MVSVQYFDHDHTAPANEYVGQIILRPNNSMTWQAAQYFLVTLMAISFTMATVFMVNGYWMILPFSILEMSVLSACFYYILRRNQIQEIVCFGAETVDLESGRKSPELQLKWQRFFTKVMVHPPKHPWYPDRITLRHKDDEHEIGAFLTIPEKKKLITELRRMIAVADSSRVHHLTD